MMWCRANAQIVELLNVVYCLAELTEFAAFVWLRIAAPDLHRPYRVPLPTWACALMLLPASCLLLTLLILPILSLNWLVRMPPSCHFKGVGFDFSSSPIPCRAPTSSLHLLLCPARQGRDSYKQCLMSKPVRDLCLAVQPQITNQLQMHVSICG